VDDIPAYVAAVCRDAMGVASLGENDNLVDHGADSLVAVEVVSRLQLDYGVEVADVFMSTPTINALVRAVESQLALKNSS
jgi:long-chain acyl-CoA synthetase